MIRRTILMAIPIPFLLTTVPASSGEPPVKLTGAAGEVRLITLDPGHFHAALIQKTMYEQISPQVRVYAPPGPDLDDHLARIEGFNSRAEKPTAWREQVYKGDDFLTKMLAERAGNVVILSGNNRGKTEYIKACVEGGLNVLSDKPMCIDAAGYKVLEGAFASAERRGVLLYDIMTERSEITTILQRQLSQNPKIFGELLEGSYEEPAIVKESVHYFFKQVAGKPIKRPTWYFDISQQGEGIVDVTTHLVDLVMWTCFPEQVIDFDRDVVMISARRWPTMITGEQYRKVTRADGFPDYLRTKLNDQGSLPCYANGEMLYKLKDAFVKISVKWDFAAPPGGGDTHYSVMRGSRVSLVIRQGAEQNYRPELYIEPLPRQSHSLARELALEMVRLQKTYPGIRTERTGNRWHVLIPDRFRVGHEAHFRQVTERYLQYLVDGKLPEWEVPNMLTKYRTTTTALEMARQ